MKAFSDKKIIDSWQKNASPWITAVQQNQIESRRLITNRAIVDTVMSTSAKTVIDIGCGEGWLARALLALGLSVSGVDVIPALVQEAKKCGRGNFYEMAYEELSSGEIAETFDAAVCNFSLLGKESVDQVFKTVPSILNRNGYFVVQTPHPSANCEQHPYKDGWREGSWVGFDCQFKDPAPWYFRTTESWFKLFRDSGYELVQFKEPINPRTGKIASLIMVGRVMA